LQDIAKILKVIVKKLILILTPSLQFCPLWCQLTRFWRVWPFPPPRCRHLLQILLETDDQSLVEGAG